MTTRERKCASPDGCDAIGEACDDGCRKQTHTELHDEIAGLRSSLVDLANAYVRLLESGRDRILMLGGGCDSVESMERGDPYLSAARAILARKP